MTKLIIGLISNTLAILAAEYLVDGFSVTDDLAGFAVVVVLFTVANSVILPILRFILAPFIWLTLGLLAVAINGLLIYTVDIFSQGITIDGIMPLVWGTIIVGAVNATVAYIAKAKNS